MAMAASIDGHIMLLLFFVCFLLG